MNLVDSSAWLAYFADEPTADFFAEAIEDADLLLVPSVCVYEVFTVVLRERGEDDAFSVVATMQQGTVVNLDADLAMEAASIGLEERLAFADSVIYTITKKYNAVLWTQDAHFADKPNVHYKPKTISSP